MRISTEGVGAHVRWIASAGGKFLGACILGRQSAIDSITANINQGKEVYGGNARLTTLGPKTYLQSQVRINGYVLATIIPNVDVQLTDGNKKPSAGEVTKERPKSAILWHADAGNMLWRKVYSMTNVPLLTQWQDYLLEKLRDEAEINRIRNTCGFPYAGGARIQDAEMAGESEGWMGAIIDLHDRDMECLVYYGLKNKEIFA